MDKFIVFRDCDTIRLRKIVVELYRDGMLIHKTRLFLRPTLRWTERVIERRKAWMLRVADIMSPVK